MTVIYIAGTMTGYDNFNRDAFNKKAKELADRGYSVLNPATLPDGLTQAQYMSICMPMVMCADEIYMLNGWSGSGGATAELALAEKLGLIITFEDKR